MTDPKQEPSVELREAKLRTTLEQLLAIQATALKPALDEASDLLSHVMQAEKIDTFLKEDATDTLVALGTSNTPMGNKQIACGLNRLPIANGGRAVEVYLTGTSYLSGAVDEDAGELIGIRETLGIRSQVAVPIDLGGQRRGVLMASCSRPNAFSEDDLRFFQAVSHWVGMVAQRAELVERLTREAAEQAERLAAEQLITFLAHDLGNHLAPLVGRASILRSRAEREGRRADLHDAEAMSRSLERLRKLITSLLDIARLEQGILELMRQPVDLAAVTRETAQLLQTPSSVITVSAPEELIAEVDPDRYRQVLENLLSNAIKHGPPGLPVQVRVEEKDGFAVILVRDEGPGIPADLRPRIFELFVAGRRSKGIGLGLYLARSITEAHGGTLELESVVGAGTTFIVRIPLTAPNDDE